LYDHDIVILAFFICTGGLMARWTIVGIGALFLVGLIVFRTAYCKKPQTVFDRPNAATEPPATTAEKAVVAIGKQTKAPFALVPATPEAEQPGQPEPAVKDKPTIKDPTTVMPPASSGPLEVLKRVYAKSSTDAHARDAESQLRSLFGIGPLPVEILRSVNCHTTVCKVDMFWTEKYPLSYMALAMQLGMQQTGIIAVESAPAPDPSGNLAYTVYVVRAGHTLADIE
jgi:hypothetical protein